MIELGVLFIVVSYVWWVLRRPRTGRPRGLQGRVAAVLATVLVLMGVIRRRLTAISASHRPFSAMRGWLTSPTTLVINLPGIRTSATGC